jgi:hypothetical protein
MKGFGLFIALILCTTAFGQVKFKEALLDNGLRYPIAIFTDNPSVQDSLNVKIQQNINDVKSSDFCIGDFAYIHKGNHLELHLVFTCIELPETEHRYLFFNLTDGSLVNYPDLFDPKKKDDALIVIKKTIKSQSNTNTCGTEFSNVDDLTWENLNIRLHKDGIQIRPSATACTSNPITIKWTEISSFLRYNFI